MPVTQDGDKLAGQGDMGGLWEWTSSVLEKQHGFEPMKLYPAYSSKIPVIDHHSTWQGLTWQQPISTTTNTILCLEDLGRRTRASLVARHCKLLSEEFRSKRSHC